MTKTVDNGVLDASLQYVVDNADKLFVCSSAPSTYAAAVAAALSTTTISSAQFETIADGDTSGRKVRAKAITGMTVDTSGTATHVALGKSSTTTLLVVNELTANEELMAGVPINSTVWDIEIGDPT